MIGGLEELDAGFSNLATACLTYADVLNERDLESASRLYHQLLSFQTALLFIVRLIAAYRSNQFDIGDSLIEKVIELSDEIKPTKLVELLATNEVLLISSQKEIENACGKAIKWVELSMADKGAVEAIRSLHER